MMKVGNYVIVKREDWKNREFKIVKIENDWLLLDLGESQVRSLGWHPNSEDMEYNFYMESSHYYYWIPKCVCYVVTKKHI